MSLINVAELKQDMVIAQDVVNPDGRFLLSKGSALTTKHLRIFKMWGVVEVDIAGVSEDEMAQKAIARFDPDLVNAVEQLFKSRFQHADLHHPCFAKLLHICSLRKIESCAASGGDPASMVAAESALPPETFPTLEPDASPQASSGSSAATPVGHPDLRRVFDGGIKLPSLPIIYTQINEVINTPTSSSAEISEVISRDVSLSARLLKLVNSTFYGFPSKIDTLSRAITVVGTRQLSTLALGMSIIDAFKDIPTDLIDMKSFWEHSIASGVIARTIASFKKIQNTERLFVSGLLHDIGRLVLYRHEPSLAKQILLAAQQQMELLHRVESNVMVHDHAGLGGTLLKKWRLPVSLENNVRYHHYPARAKDMSEPAIIHLADIITNALDIGTSGERLVPALVPTAWERVGITPNTLATIISHVDGQVEEIQRYLL